MRRRLSILLAVAMVSSLVALGATPGLAADEFTDVPASNIFHDDISWLAESGITRGCNPPDNTEFCPERNVTRGEMAAFFVRGLGLTSTDGATDFTDDDDSIFENDIERLSAAGITRGCNPPDNTEFCPDDFVTREQMAAFFHRALGGPMELTIAHINDHHSNLQPRSQTLQLGGAETDVETGGFARITTKINDIAASNENVLKIHAGDAITGTLFYTLFQGEADADVMNEVCFDTFTLGNHEFDDSDEGLAQFLDWLAEGDCDTEVLSANTSVAAGTPLADDYFKPYTVKYFNGKRVGIIGITIANKTKNSSSPLETTNFADEVETTQKYVDELQAMGVERIIASTHYQYDNEQALAAAVTGLDAVIGGDSHTLLGDEFTAFGLGPAGPYPTVVDNADGDPVCVVQAWQYSEVVGQLDIRFNEDGVVTSCGGNPTLLLGDTFTREVGEEDVELEGADLQAVLDDIAATPVLEVVEPDAATQSIIDAYAEEVDELAAEVIADVTQHMCLERIPGQDYRVSPQCPSGYGLPNGGDAQQIVAEAFLARAFEADISIQNAGGVRVEIEEGEFTIADAYTVLPFSNTLVNMELTGQEIVDVLNEAFTYAIAPDGSTGAYPYGTGIRWTTNFTDEVIEDVEINPRNEGTWEPIDLDATYVVATNDFIARGQDGYDTFGVAFDEGRFVDTFINYAQGLIDYVEIDKAGVLDPPTQYSTNNVVGAYTP
jgi:5'-nucleotidase / UDP-sugar diphosphatase